MTVKKTLKPMLIAAFVATQTLIAGSSNSGQVPISPGDRCSRCNRLLSDRFVAAEMIAEPTSVAHKFRTIRCMLTYLKESSTPVKQLFVADDGTGKLIDVEDAVFVPVLIDAHTAEANYGIGETDYVAFGSEGAAERFAAENRTTTMSWPAVVFYAAFLPTRPEVRPTAAHDSVMVGPMRTR